MLGSWEFRLASKTPHRFILSRVAVYDSCRPGHVESFESANQVAAQPFTWSFTTARPVAKSASLPRVFSITPASGTEVALLTPVKECSADWLRRSDKAGSSLTLAVTAIARGAVIAIVSPPKGLQFCVRTVRNVRNSVYWRGSCGRLDAAADGWTLLRTVAEPPYRPLRPHCFKPPRTLRTMRTVKSLPCRVTPRSESKEILQLAQLDLLSALMMAS
jgi:hypothetical protein